MAQITSGAPGGWEQLQVGTIDASGYPTGVAGATPANDTTSSARRSRFPVNATPTIEEPERTPIPGGDTILGYFSWGGGTMSALELELSGIDAAFESVITGANVDTTTNSEITILGTNAGNNNPPSIFLILSQRYQSVEDATRGQERYLNMVVMAATARVLDHAMQNRSTVTRRISVTPTKASRLLWGGLIGANQNWTNDEADHFYLVSTYPLSLTTYIGDGTETDFVAGYRPTSSVVTLAATPNHFARNGTSQALSSLSTTTGVAVMAAAGAAGDRNVLAYNTRFADI